ncbi:MAG: hypothetical protein KDE14_10135 [Rhodobacteraceae bacterium]|nr:hypothetical protein [Paracoccaceae bacterium]
MSQARNIFVVFELFSADRSDERIREVIESFGVSWARISRNTFYLHGDLDAQFVGNKVWTAMSMDDKLLVIDSTKNDARWYNIKPEISQFLINNWHG